MSVTEYPPAGPPRDPSEPIPPLQTTAPGGNGAPPFQQAEQAWQPPPDNGAGPVGGPTTTSPPLPRDMMTFEVDFTADVDQPIPFAIHFRNDRTGLDEVHEFTAVGDAGAAGPLAVASLVRYDPNGKTLVDLNALKTFFARVLIEGLPAEGDEPAVPSDYERLLALLDRRDLKVPMDTLVAIFNALMQRYSGRPLEPQASSRVVRRSTGRS